MRKVRIGVIGPEDSVKQTLKISDYYKDLYVKAFPYDTTEMTREIIKEHGQSIDQWMFSGPVPYDFAIKEGLIRHDQGTYATLHGSSLLSVLLYISLKNEDNIRSASLDSIEQDQLDSIRSEGINHITFHRYEANGYVPKEKLIDFHIKKYESGEVDVAITAIHSVYQALLEYGLPVYRIKPSELSVRLAFDYLRQRAYAMSYRKKQFVMVGFEVCYSTAIEEGFVPYKIQHQELEVNRVLLKFSEKINGSFAKVGSGKYFIYTTRGDIELFQDEQSIEELTEHIFSQSQLNVRVGIGYGHTVFEADEHVHMAFDYARNDCHHHIILVNEDKEVVELRDSSKTTYGQRFSAENWEEKYSDLGISPSQLSRIYSLSKHYEKDEMTAQELAVWIQSTERNARRILNELERSGLAQIVGEESGQRGRPKKVYQLQDPF